MVHRLSCVAPWLLLLTAVLTGLGASLAEAQFPQTCLTNWCTIDMSSSTYVYNNQWNTRGARGSQSITADSPTAWSTSWDWKRGQRWTVTTYASAVTGWHWGWHFPAEQTGLPVPVAAHTPVIATVAYDYLPDATCGVSRTCTYDVTFELWFHDTDSPGPDSVPPLFELMVWLSYSRADLWIGYTPVATDVVVGGYHWNVFQTSSTNAVFVPIAGQDDVTEATFNLTEFIDEILNRDLGIDPSWYLTSVEFGIEVYRGRGTLNVTNYEVTAGSLP
jgi:hypothetical protein